MRPSVTAKESERRRRLAVHAVIKQKMTVESVAKKYQVQIRAVYRWLAAYRKGGDRAIAAKPAPGAPRKLNRNNLKRLEKIILKGAKAAGFANDLWTCARIAEVIKREFGVTYHFNHVGKILAQMGWSPQRPEKRAIERNEKAIRSWVKKEFPEIKKKPAKPMQS